MPREISRDQELTAKLQDPYLRRSLKTALHLRRYMPFYVFGVFWIVTLALFPSIRPGSNQKTAAASSPSLRAGGPSGTDANTADTTGDTTLDTGAAAESTGAATGGAVAAASGQKTTAKAGTTAGGSAKAAADAAPAADAIQRGTGTSRLGFECKPGVAQVPGSQYALPCQNVYNGPNGGATFRGVSADKIKIAYRKFPDSPNQQAVDKVNQQAGYASSDVTEQVRQEFVKYFNKAYELYGRQVEYTLYTSDHGGQTQSTDEAQSKGKENACLDADELAKEQKQFAVIDGSSPFSECAAERQMPTFAGGAYFPESWYKQYNPYVWNTIMECERISHQVAEYLGKRMINQPATFAGDTLMQNKTRYFATYVPDNDGYQHCVNIYQNDLKTKYGVKDTGARYNYQLDVSRFPDQAAAASVQFKSAGATTVVMACDYISVTVLTSAAAQQQWFPEWFLIGVGATDADNSARLYDQSEVNGHMFGMSQLGATQKLIGPDSEPGRVYKQATGKQIPDGTTGGYFDIVNMFNLLQAAGPNLTPDALATGAMSIPPLGAPDYSYGYWSYTDGPDGTPGAGDHTTTEDSREVFWVAEGNGSGPANGTAKDPYFNGSDGKNGTLKEAVGGKRFRNNEWPATPVGKPEIYPPH